MLSILASDKTPLIVALFIGMFTWFANKAVSDTESLLLIGYSIDGSGVNKTITVKNLSLRKSLQEGVLAVACSGGEECLQNKDGGYATLKLHSPYGVQNPSFAFSDKTIVQINFTIPTGGRIEIVPHLTKDANLLFYLNNVAKYDQIRFAHNSSFVAFIFEYYYHILFGVLAVLLVVVFPLSVLLAAANKTKPAGSAAGDF